MKAIACLVLLSLASCTGLEGSYADDSGLERLLQEEPLFTPAALAEVAARQPPRSMSELEKNLGREAQPHDLLHPGEIENYLKSRTHKEKKRMFIELDDLKLAPGTYDFWSNALDRANLGLL